jgi:hypothetical protein
MSQSDGQFAIGICNHLRILVQDRFCVFCERFFEVVFEAFVRRKVAFEDSFAEQKNKIITMCLDMCSFVIFFEKEFALCDENVFEFFVMLEAGRYGELQRAVGIDPDIAVADALIDDVVHVSELSELGKMGELGGLSLLFGKDM